MTDEQAYTHVKKEVADRIKSLVQIGERVDRTEEEVIEDLLAAATDLSFIMVGGHYDREIALQKKVDDINNDESE